jgi:hypothetical protein
MPRPEEYTVKTVIGREEWSGNKGPMVTYELLLEEDSQVRKGHVQADQDPKIEAGQKVEGWLNDGGKFGFATGKPSGGSATTSSNGRSDATGQSIERQTAAKAAAELAASIPPGPTGAPAVLANFEALFDSVLGKIQGAPQMASQPSGDPAGDNVPF